MNASEIDRIIRGDGTRDYSSDLSPEERETLCLWLWLTASMLTQGSSKSGAPSDQSVDTEKTDQHQL